MARTLEQARKMIVNLEQEVNRRVRGIARAAGQEFDVEMHESQAKTPEQYGRLKASHRRHEPEVNVNTRNGDVVVKVAITVGGTVEDGQLVDYALPVHENLEAHHPKGEAKFLESTLSESAPYIMDRIAARYRKNGGR